MELRSFVRSLALYASRVAVRRVVLVLVLAVLAWSGIGRAEAQSLTCGGGTYCSTRQQAYEQCQVYLGTRADRYNKECRWTTQSGGGRYTAWGASSEGGTQSTLYAFQYSNPECPTGTEWNEDTKTCATPCAQRETMWGYDTPGDGAACSGGCEYITALDPTHEPPFGISPTGAQCTSTPENEPVDAMKDTDGDGEPDVSDDFPNDPSETKDTDGDGIGDNADFAPEDPTDGKDGEGETDGDDEGDNIASGGGDCNAPPTCSGDGIQCAQLYQQWKMRCTLGATVTGDPTVCAASYSCTGDSGQCAQVALLRVQACKEAGDGEGDTPGDANGNGIPDELEQGIAEVPGEDPVLGESGDLWGNVNKNGWLGGNSCPGLPSATIAGQTVDLSGPACEQSAFLGYAIYLFFLTASAFVIGRAASGT